MVCQGEEAQQVSRQLADHDSGCLITYRRVEDMVLNAPSGQVALVILAGQDDPAGAKRTLQWLRHRWPGCPVTVVSGAGADYERTARQGGALYVDRGLAEHHLPAIVAHALKTHPNKVAQAS